MSLRIIFSVQGCGRGHIAQAIALKKILADAGHEVVGVLVGTESPEDIPTYLTDRIAAPVVSFRSPQIDVSSGARSIAWVRTVSKAERGLGAWRKSLCRILGAVDRFRPDLVVSFFEPLTVMTMRRVCTLHPGLARAQF